MKRDPTRANILEILRKGHFATADELAHALHLTAAAVRYHLIRLERQGLIEIAAPPTSTTAQGRPAQAYRLTREGQPDNLEGLSSALLVTYLSQAKTDSGLEAIERFWTGLARQLAGPAPDIPQPSRRLSFTIGELNRMNYQAHWEAGAHGPRIYLSNCPYAAILPQFPGLCLMDRHLLEQWTRRELVQIIRMDFKDRKRPECIFEGLPPSRPPTLQSS